MTGNKMLNQIQVHKRHWYQYNFLMQKKNGKVITHPLKKILVNM